MMLIPGRRPRENNRLSLGLPSHLLLHRSLRNLAFLHAEVDDKALGQFLVSFDMRMEFPCCSVPNILHCGVERLPERRFVLNASSITSAKDFSCSAHIMRSRHEMFMLTSGVTTIRLRDFLLR